MSYSENSVDTVGSILKLLRNKRGITQATLAKNIGYTPRQIRRYENDEFELSISAIEIFSNYYNVDLFNYIVIIRKYGSIREFDEYSNFRKIIENQDFKQIRSRYNVLLRCSNFNSINMLQLMHYSHSILLSNEEKKYSDSIEECFKGLKVTNSLDYLTSLKNSVLSEMTYPLLFQITSI